MVGQANAQLPADRACDVLITGAMVYYLQRSKTAYEKTNRCVRVGCHLAATC